MMEGMTVRTMVWSSAATKTAAHSATMARTVPRETLVVMASVMAARSDTSTEEP